MSPPEGALYFRVIPETDRCIGVFVMAFNYRVTVGNTWSPETYEDGFCYEDASLAIQAAMEWTGEGDPLEGWVKHPYTRRYRPGGDPAKETRSR